MTVGATGITYGDVFLPEDFVVCYYCDEPLDPQYDYSCPSCGHETCDADSQACQEDNCDVMTCFRCVDLHLRTCHPTILT